MRFASKSCDFEGRHVLIPPAPAKQQTKQDPAPAMRAPDFLLSAFFSIHGAAGSPAHAPGLRRKCPPRSLRITSPSRLIMSFGTYSTSFREKYKNDADMYENEFTPKPYVRISSHRSVKRPQRGLSNRAKKQSLTQSVRPRKVGSAPGGLTACYRLTAHKKSITCSGTWI